MPGIRVNKNCKNAMQAVAFVLAESNQNNKTHDISEVVAVHVDTRMDGLRKEMEEVMAALRPGWWPHWTG